MLSLTGVASEPQADPEALAGCGTCSQGSPGGVAAGPWLPGGAGLRKPRPQAAGLWTRQSASRWLLGARGGRQAGAPGARSPREGPGRGASGCCALACAGLCQAAVPTPTP